MRTVKFASIFLAVFAGLFALSCSKQQEEKKADEARNVTFSIAVNRTGADVYELIVRHDGKDSDTWYGFLVDDMTSEAQSMIYERLSQVDKNSIHVGKSQTIVLKDLVDRHEYRYIAFGVTLDKEQYGTIGDYKFTTDPDRNKAQFQIDAKEVGITSATVEVRHFAYDDFTWVCFASQDFDSELNAQVSNYFNKAGKEALQTGKKKDVTIEGLQADSKYQLIVGGVTEEGVVYGTPSAITVETLIDPSSIEFEVKLIEKTKNTAKVAVSYNSEKTLSWYGFVTNDADGELEDLVAAKVATISASDYLSGPQEISLSGLTPETKYRYIVTGIDANGRYGKAPVEVAFETLSAAYDDCQFTVTADKVAANSVEINVKHTGREEFEYYGFATTDLEKSIDELVAALPAGADEHLLKGKDNTFLVNDLDPEKDYRYIVVGRNEGSNYGYPGEVKFKTTAVVFALDENWKVTYEGYDANESYPEIVKNTVTTPGISGKYFLTAVQKAALSGAALETFVQGTMAPYYQQQMTSMVAAGNSLDNILLEDTATSGLSAFEYDTDYIILALGFTSNGYATGHYAYTEVNKPDPAVKLTYVDFIGKWYMGDITLEFKQLEAGSTYEVLGIPGTTGFRTTSPKPVTANFVDGKLELPEQIVGEWNNTNYGTCYDVICGLFEATSTSGSVMHFVNYPRYADTPSTIFTLCKYPDGSYVVRPGSSENGTLDMLGVRWVIAAGQYKGQGNNYTDDIALPATMEKAPEANATYSKWLGTWNLTAVVYHYDASDNYIEGGDTEEELPISIVEKKVNESYLINGIGPENKNYAVLATLDADGKLVVTPQIVYTWTHSSVGEINETLVGLYTNSAGQEMLTWSPSVTLFTGEIGADGSATLTPGKTADDDVFTGFQFQQRQSAGAYGYGGYYNLPNKLTRPAGTSSFSLQSVSKSNGLRPLVPSEKAQFTFKK